MTLLKKLIKLECCAKALCPFHLVHKGKVLRRTVDGFLGLYFTYL